MKRIILGVVIAGLWSWLAAILVAGGPEGGGSPWGSHAKGAESGPGEPAMTEQQEADVLKFLEERRPEFYDQLKGLKQSNPIHYKVAMHSVWRMYREWRQMPKDVQDALLAEQEAKIKMIRLSRAVQDAGPNGDAKLKEQLKVAVTEHFGAEQKRMEAQLTRLEEQIERLRKDLKERTGRRDQIIEERLENFSHGHGGPMSRPAE